MSTLPLTSEKIETNSLTVGQGTPLQKAISVVAILDFPATGRNSGTAKIRVKIGHNPVYSLSYR